MNPNVLAALNLINSIFVTNGQQEITGANSNPVLVAMLNSLYGITGNNQSLSTSVKTNLVAAINELKDGIDGINPINLYTGGADPNVEPPNGGDIDVLDFYTQTDIGGAIALWLYTGIPGLGWLNLTQTVSAVLFTEQNLSVAQKKQALKNLGYIEIGGNLFEYRRNPNNNTIGFIPGDIALNGWITSTNFGRLLVYVSGDATNITSWNVLDNIEF